MIKSKTKTTNEDAHGDDANIEYPSGTHPNNWNVARLNKINIFVSKSSGAIRYLSEEGTVRTIDGYAAWEF